MFYQKDAYRLNDYRIIESEDGMLWWEAHFPLAMLRRGKCFLIGDILIIGRALHEEDGCLILEFDGQLKNLPAWSRTTYYCYEGDLLDVKTGSNLPEDVLKQKMALCEIKGTGRKSFSGPNEGKFRLGRYQIIVRGDVDVEWQTYSGINEVIGGRCIVESDVLFIGAREYEIGGQDREEFIGELNGLPQWEGTFAWCKSMVLQVCRAQKQARKPEVAIQDGNARSPSPDRQPRVTYMRGRSGIEGKLLAAFTRLRTSLRRIKAPKFRLKYFVPFIIAGLLFGLAMLLYTVKSRSHWHHSKHHHEHAAKEDADDD